MTIDKARYLMELKALLSFMDADERAATVATYRKIFERVGEEREQELIEELGSPVRLVLKLEKSYRNGRLNEVLEAVSAQYEEEPEDIEEENYIPENIEIAESVSEEAVEEEAEALSEEALPFEEPEIIEEPEAEAEVESEPEPEPEPEAEKTEPKPKVEEFPQWEEKPKRPAAEERRPLPAAPPKPEPRLEEDEEAEPKPPAKGSMALAVLLTPFLIVLAAGILALTLAFSLVPGALCALLSIVGGYFVSYAFSSMHYIPDLLMVTGLGVVLFGLVVWLLGIVIRLLVSGVKLAFNMLSSVYGKLLGKEGPQDE